ncbi:MAG TPA: ABC transporter permease, partial [Lachnospiraceae bacterium]|nr:ABC transporter permease [Lachnospiraceae bacterium]
MNTITRLAISNDRKNRTRSILIIISIALTTMLLTIIATFCYGFVKSNRINAKQLYGNYYGTYNDVNDEQLKEMKLRSEFSDIGLVAYSGAVESKNDIYLYWGDDTAYEMGNLKQAVEEGTFPVRKDQIVANRSFFKELGYDNPRIGDKIQVSSRFNSDSTYKKVNFVISGFIEDSKTDETMKKYAGYVSKEFYEEQVPSKDRVYSAYFRLSDSVDITYDGADDLLKELAEKCGISKENVSVNKYYLFWVLDPGKDTISGGILITSCVVLFSVIVIYNIFQVGISQKIQEYGKLKAIGATRKQLKRIVLREGMLLACIGIPIGLLLGSVAGKIVFSWLMKQANALRGGKNLIEVSIFSLPIILLVIAVSILTVYIALQKPMRIVARISPIEAIRFQENGRGKRKARKGRKEVGANTLMMASLSGNRKRTIVTVCTMGLSCVLLIVIANFIENIDSEYVARGDVEYGQFEIS